MGEKVRNRVCICCGSALSQSAMDNWRHKCSKCEYALLSEKQRRLKIDMAAKWRRENPEKAKESRRRWERSREKVNASRRRNYQKNYQKIKGDPEKWKKVLCRARVQYAIKTGNLIKGRCECCGSKNTQAHHEDYDRPYAVRWLCPSCHQDVRGYFVLPEKAFNARENIRVFYRSRMIEST